MIYYTKLISNLKEIQMQKITLSIFLILILIPFTQGFSQEYYDNAQTLLVSLSNDTPFVYQDSEGYTVVVGMVENNDSKSAVTNVRIQVNFYDDLDPSPIDSTIGGTTLEAIPPNGKSTYSIRSSNPDSEITQASVTLLGLILLKENKRDYLFILQMSF